MTAKNLALATITGTDRPYPAGSRSFGTRLKDVFNVRDYGAKGDFFADDTAAIQACINDVAVLFASSGGGVGGTVFFPPGGYNISAPGINIAGMGGSGRITGSGAGATTLQGNLPNGFIFYQDDGSSGPNEISHISLVNTSLNIGSGALRISNSSAHIYNCGFRGMINVLLPFNIYDMIIERCGGSANRVDYPGTGYVGTLGVAGYAPHINGWRTTNNYMACFQLWGSNSCALIGNGIENCEVGMLLGMGTGWGSHCTVNNDVLTVGGSTGSSESLIGGQVFMTGLPMKEWGANPGDTSLGTTIVANTASVSNSATTLSGSTMTLTAPVVGGYGFRVGATVTGVGVIPGTTITAVPGGGNLSAGAYTVTPGGQSAGPVVVTSLEVLTGAGAAGTYRLSSGGYSITTPVPMWSRYERGLTGVTLSSFQNEACHYAVYANNIGSSHISAAGGNSALGECVGAWGDMGPFGVSKGFNPHSGFYIKKAGTTVFSGCSASNNCYAGGFYFDPTQPVNNTTFISCLGQHGLDNAVTATISNGSGGAGTILNVTARSSGSGIAIGMAVTGSGVTAGTRIIGSSATDNTLTGYSHTGTYRVNNSQNTSPTGVVHGPDWVLPTTTEGYAGLELINCGTIGAVTTALTLATVFTALPGEAGASPYISRFEGQEYSITDGQKSTGGAAAFGDTVIGGSTGHYKVRYNGTNWTRCG